jgi:hypothetical protein
MCVVKTPTHGALELCMVSKILHNFHQNNEKPKTFFIKKKIYEYDKIYYQNYTFSFFIHF